MKIVVYIGLGILLAFMILAIIISILGFSNDINEKNRKLIEQREKAIKTLLNWSESLNPLFQQEMFDILEVDENGNKKL